MANQKIAFGGNITNYAFQLAGRRILYAPVNTALPATIRPIYDDTLPTAPVGWNDFGATVNSVVDISVNFTTADIKTGVLGNVRRTYIEGQDGQLTAKLFRYEPEILAQAQGQTNVVSTIATSLNRSIKDVYYGGQLGNKLALLVFEDFDTPVVEDLTLANTYEQVWFYTPKAQKSNSINLGEFETKTNIHTLDFKLLPYTNTAAGGRDILLQQRWLGVL